MQSLSRRNALAAAAADGLLTTTTAVSAQTGVDIPQPRRPAEAGSDPGSRNVARDVRNPDLLVPPSTDHGTPPNLRSRFSTCTCGWNPAAGPVR